MTAKRVLITRPAEDAAPLAAELRRLGYLPVIHPLIVIRAVEAEADLTLKLQEAGALLFSSANGLRALARYPHGLAALREKPLLLMGGESERLARALGARETHRADIFEGGGGHELANLARHIFEGRARPPLLYMRGRHIARDMAGELSARGFRVRSAVLYEAERVRSLEDPAASLIRRGLMGAALFFSRRTAEIFVRLVRKAGLLGSMGRLSAICFSGAVAEPLGALSMKKILIAPQPRRDALLRTLADLLLCEDAGEGEMRKKRKR